MDIRTAIEEHSFILTEAAVIEPLRRSGDVELHPLLENALLIYDEKGRNELSELYRNFIGMAFEFNIPMIICAPTWRANRERVKASKTDKDINGDAIRFMRYIQERWGPWTSNIFVGGLVGCKNDCYKPEEGLASEEAEDFHSWQIERLSEACPDFLLAATLPAVPEATGIALALAKTKIPYIISFVINRRGRILDETSLERAFGEIDAAAGNPPLGYMINCSHPSFLRADEQSESVMSRLIGFQANASSLDQCELDGAAELQADDVSEWGDLMIDLNQRYGVKILGGCCGTTAMHLEYVVYNI